MSDILNIRQQICPTKSSTVQMSYDGVGENKSTTVSLDVFTVSFDGCRIVFPKTLYRSLLTNDTSEDERIQPILTDLTENECTLRQVVADNPKRAILRKCLSHSSFFPCEYCYLEGTSFKDTSYKKKWKDICDKLKEEFRGCLLYTSPSPRDS